MHPDLLHLGPLTIRSYGTMIVVGFLLGVLLARRRGRRFGISGEEVMDLAFWVLLAGLVGAKLLYFLVEYRAVVESLAHILEEPREVLTLLGTGFVFYGGLLGAGLVGWRYMRRSDLDAWTMFDVVAPSVMLGLGCGRIGCFLAGCCYGKPWTHTCAVAFPPEAVAPAGVPRHPTQLYMMAACFLVALVTHLWTSRRRFRGEIFWLMVLLYSLLRFVIELFRGDPRGAVPGMSLSTSQFIGILAVAVSLIAMARLRRTHLEEPT